MVEFNSDDHYIYYSEQESLRRNRVALIVNKSPKCSSWVQSHKLQNDLCFQGKAFTITVIHVYGPAISAQEAEVECFYSRPSVEDLQDFLELTLKKKKKNVLFIIGDWNAKDIGHQAIKDIVF